MYSFTRALMGARSCSGITGSGLGLEEEEEEVVVVLSWGLERVLDSWCTATGV